MYTLESVNELITTKIFINSFNEKVLVNCNLLLHAVSREIPSEMMRELKRGTKERTSLAQIKMSITSQWWKRVEEKRMREKERQLERE